MTLESRKMMKKMNKLYNIRDDLNSLSDWYNSTNRAKSRSKVLERCVRERLDRSIEQHSQHIDKICDYLKWRSEAKVLHQLSIYNKKKTKKHDKTK